MEFGIWTFGGGRNLHERNQKEIRHANWARNGPKFPEELDMWRDSHNFFRVGKKDPMWNNSDTVRDVCFSDNSFWKYRVDDKPLVGPLPTEEEEEGTTARVSLEKPSSGTRSTRVPGKATEATVVVAAPKVQRSRSAPLGDATTAPAAQRGGTTSRTGEAAGDGSPAGTLMKKNRRGRNPGPLDFGRLARPYSGEPTQQWPGLMRPRNNPSELGGEESETKSRAPQEKKTSRELPPPDTGSRAGSGLSTSTTARAEMIAQHHRNHTRLFDGDRHWSTHHAIHIFGAEHALDQERLNRARARR